MFVRQQGQLLAIDSPAKLNLFLEVCARRADGFHEIETVMTTLDLHDTLLFSQSSNDAISFDCRFVSNPPHDHQEINTMRSEQNLVLKAARLLQRETDTSFGANIILHKRIPMQAGLAGGSSNAAATLVGLNQLWELNLDDAMLAKLAAQLGSDIGFFLSSSAWGVATGRGEVISSFPVSREIHFVILKPNTGLSTAAVYQNCHITNQSKNSNRLIKSIQNGNLFQLGMEMHNSLQQPAVVMNNDVCKALTLLSNQPVLKAQMTGSGSACFGLCSHRKQAMAIAATLRSQYSGSVFVVRSQA